MSLHHHQPSKLSALDAKTEALKLAFAPISFQTAYALVKLGILSLIAQHGDEGLSVKVISKTLKLSEYGVQVLLDLGLDLSLVWRDGEQYILDKVGHFVVTDSMVQVNMDFCQDVCYQGMASLLDSIKTGKPEGLKVFGDWPTIYPALSSLPEPAKTSWHAFDHYYSDKSFPDILPEVFKQPVKRLLDVGGNTGKWALSCFNYDPHVHITIADLPEQLAVASANIQQAGFADRFSTHPVNLLNPDATLPKGHDVIWMSQFLDCFSLEEIHSILSRTVQAMTPNTRLYILETLWDRQDFEAASFTINCTSLYFTCLANGNSRMYESKDFLDVIRASGLSVVSEKDGIGAGHTLLCCRLTE